MQQLAVRQETKLHRRPAASFVVQIHREAPFALCRKPYTAAVSRDDGAAAFGQLCEAVEPDRLVGVVGFDLDRPGRRQVKIENQHESGLAQ